VNFIIIYLFLLFAQSHASREIWSPFAHLWRNLGFFMLRTIIEKRADRRVPLTFGLSPRVAGSHRYARRVGQKIVSELFGIYTNCRNSPLIDLFTRASNVRMLIGLVSLRSRFYYNFFFSTLDKKHDDTIIIPDFAHFFRPS